MAYQESFDVNSRGRGTVEITVHPQGKLATWAGVTPGIGARAA